MGLPLNESGKRFASTLRMADRAPPANARILIDTTECVGRRIGDCVFLRAWSCFFSSERRRCVTSHRSRAVTSMHLNAWALAFFNPHAVLAAIVDRAVPSRPDQITVSAINRSTGTGGPGSVWLGQPADNRCQH